MCLHCTLYASCPQRPLLHAKLSTLIRRAMYGSQHWTCGIASFKMGQGFLSRVKPPPPHNALGKSWEREWESTCVMVFVMDCSCFCSCWFFLPVSLGKPENLKLTSSSLGTSVRLYFYRCLANVLIISSLVEENRRNNVFARFDMSYFEEVGLYCDADFLIVGTSNDFLSRTLSIPPPPPPLSLSLSLSNLVTSDATSILIGLLSDSQHDRYVVIMVCMHIEWLCTCM